jgi:hypothetical protein
MRRIINAVFVKVNIVFSMLGIDSNMNVVFNVSHAANKAAAEQSALPEISQIIGNSPRVASPPGDKARKVARVTALLMSRDDAGETGNKSDCVDSAQHPARRADAGKKAPQR